MRYDQQTADDANEDVAAVARATAALLTAVNASDLCGVLDVWCDDGVMMPPHQPSVHRRTAIERYFRQLFREKKLQFSFSASRIEVSGDIAVERVEYAALIWSMADGSEMTDAGKGVHVFRRQADGSWKLAMDIWNSDSPPG